MSIKRLTFAAVAMAGSVALAACGGDSGSSPTDVVATVDGTDITVEEVDLQYEIMNQNSGAPADGATDDPAEDEDSEREQSLRANALNGLVYVQILLDAAEERGLEATEEDIQATLDRLVVQYGGEADLYSALEEQGVPREEVDRQIQVVTTQDLIIADLTPEVTDEQVQAAYDDGAAARHILVEDEDTANDVLDRLDGGEDFAAVAEEVSTGPSAADGGELGFSQPGDFVPEFDEALFAAGEGEVVGPVETTYGFHVIEHMAKPAIADVEDEIRGKLEAQATSEGNNEFGTMMTEWVKDSEVTIHDASYGMWDAELGMVVPEETSTPDDAATPEPNGTPSG